MAYKDLINNLQLFEIKTPKTIVPSPTEDDYKLGFIRRYFTQKVNDSNGHIFEINEEVYSEYSNSPFWKVIDLKWRIVGPQNTTYKNDGNIDDIGVLNSNKNSIGKASFSLKNIGLYLPNLLQFYKN